MSPPGLFLPPPPATSRGCPCGTRRSIDDCCGRIHADHSAAHTAEQVMRARYSAHVLQRRRFIEQSWHPSTRPASIDFDDGVVWIDLAIEATSGGLPTDQTGTVSFVARYRELRAKPPNDTIEQRLIERSRFVREAGVWLYLDAVP